MDAFREDLMLRLALELAASHGTFFAAALLAEMGVPFQTALEALTSHSRRLTLFRAIRSLGKSDLRL
jgi:hypothetical protein